MFDERNPGTWGTPPRDYVWRQVDPTTGEHHLFAPDGRNLSDPVTGPRIGDFPPQTAVNAVIVAAMLDHPRHPEHDWPWADMTPVVVRWTRIADPSALCPADVWQIEVRYSSEGYRAIYGVTADNVPQLYAD